MTEQPDPFKGASVSASDSLRTRFVALWTRCPVAASERAENIFDSLVKLYGESHRHYHTMEHIQRCLEEFDQAVAFMDNPDAVELAIWFHDAIYDLNMDNNEQRSTELLRQCVGEAADRNFLQKVCDLIMATTHHIPPKSEDEGFIMDIDLYSFSQLQRDFEQDSQLIRAEYIDTDDSDYYSGQLFFLKNLLDRPTFFFTDFFQKHYEETAQDNIQRLIAELHAHGYH